MTNRTYRTNKEYRTYKTYRSYMTYAAMIVIIASFFHAPTASAAILSRPPNNLSLVGYWSFDEGVGTKAGDMSGRGNNGAFSGSPSWATGGHGAALSFAGSSLVDMGSAMAATFPEVTISAWVYPTSVSSWKAIVQTRTTGDQALYIHGGHIQFYNSCDSTGSVAVGIWSYVVVTIDSSNNIVYYINGASSGGCSGSSNHRIIDYLHISGINTGDSENFLGTIDDVRVYNRALSAADVAALYRAGGITGKGVSRSGLVGYWPLNEGRGGKAGDMSGNGYNGTITGATWADGRRGKALSFDGSDDELTTASLNLNLSSSPYTFLAWVKAAPASSSANPSMTVLGNFASIGFSIISAGTHYQVKPWVGGTADTYGTISWNVWHHIAVVYTAAGSNNRIVYVDGVSVGTGTNGTAADFSGTVEIGDNPYAPSEVPAALIDDARIYNRALTAAEIKTIYGEGEVQINSSQNKLNGTLDSGLVGLWSFNGQDYNSASTTAEVLDRSGNGLNGDNTGAKRAIGKVGQGLEFSGGSEYVSVAGNSTFDLSRGTIAGWFKFDDMSGGVGISAGAGWLDERFVIHFGYVDNGKIKFTISNAGSYDTLTSDFSPLMGRWYHIAATYDGTNKKIYVNGVLDKSAGSAITPATTSVPFYIGKTIGLAPDNSDGVYDEIRVYNRALSADEVKQLYNAGK